MGAGFSPPHTKGETGHAKLVLSMLLCQQDYVKSSIGHDMVHVLTDEGEPSNSDEVLSEKQPLNNNADSTDIVISSEDDDEEKIKPHGTQVIVLYTII